jgi:hypothetical protein
LFKEYIGSERQKDSDIEIAAKLKGTADTLSQSMILFHDQLASTDWVYATRLSPSSTIILGIRRSQ